MKPQAKALVAKQRAAFAEANKVLEQEIIGSIGSPIWRWPGQTVRQSGAVAGSPRDIIDSGALLNSYHVEKRSATQTAHVFDAEYTAAVYNGATLRNGGTIPARPFAEAPLADFPDTFTKAYKKLP